MIKSNLTLLAACSSSGDGEVNEDFLGWSNNAAWVLDGATGVGKNDVIHGTSAYWFVRQFSVHLEEQLRATPVAPIYDLLNGVIEETRESLSSHGIDITASPSAAFVMIRHLTNVVEICSLGDCKALYLDKNRNIQCFYDESLEPFESRTLSRLAKLRQDSPNLAQKKIIEKLMPTIRENRTFMNAESGYSILNCSDLPEGALKTVEIPFTPNEKFVLMTDGFLRYSEVFDLGSYDVLYEKAIESPLQSTLDEIRKIEIADPECKSFIRVKKSDDATCVVVTFTE